MSNLFRVFEKFPTIETDRFLLRQIEVADYEDIYAIYSDKEVIKYQGEAPISSFEEVKDYIAFINNGFKNKYFIRWCITEKGENRVIGLVALHHIDYRNLNAQVGYILNKNYWGKGIMSTVLKEIIKFIFNELRFHRLEVSIHPQNMVSIKLAQKMGFTKEGLMKECVYNKCTNQYEDRIIMGLINS